MTGRQFNALQCGFASDGTRLYYFDYSNSSIFIYNPSTDPNFNEGWTKFVVDISGPPPVFHADFGDFALTVF